MYLRPTALLGCEPRPVLAAVLTKPLHIGYAQVKTLRFANFGNKGLLTCEFCKAADRLWHESYWPVT